MKYIVYLTVNLINYKIYIGEHHIDGDGKDGYLGNGVYCNKPWTYKHPKYPFQAAVKKYGPKNFRRITLAEFDTESDALELEARLVTDEFVQLPWTYNVALGGGKIPKTNKHIYQYTLTGEFIKEFDSVREVERLLGFNHSSIANSVRHKSTSHGFLWSYFKCDKLDVTEYSIFNLNCPIYLYNSDGTFFKQLNSIKETADYFNTPSTRISSAIKTKNLCFGYYISKELVDLFEKPKKFIIKNKPIYQYTIEGNFVQSWESVTNVWKHFNLSSANPILNAIKKNTISCNYRWSLEKVSKLDPIITKNKKVGIYKDSILIQAYDSIKKFRAEHSSSEWVCLKSGTPTSDGRLIKYIS